MKTEAVFFLDENDVYNGPEPYFYNKEHFDWVQILEENWQIIRDEMQGFISGILGISAGVLILYLLKNEELIELIKVFKTKFWKVKIVSSPQEGL